MWKKTILAIIAVFVLWSLLDLIVYGTLFADHYQATAALWRPMPEMKVWVMRIVNLILSITFVGIYACLIAPKSLARALRYGAIYGFGLAAVTAYGSYATMPIPYTMALTWFVTLFIEVLLGALVLGLIVKEN